MRDSVLRILLEIVGSKRSFFAKVSQLLRCKSRAAKGLHENDLPVFEDKERGRKNEF